MRKIAISCVAAEANEDCYFNLFTKYSKDTVDCTFAYHSTICYECLNVYNCYDTRFSMYCENTAESWFCYDMKGCKNCLLSHGLRQKRYCIFNKQYTKEKYEDYLKKLQLNTYPGLTAAVAEWKKMLDARDVIYRDQYQVQCENSTGNNLKNCKCRHLNREQLRTRSLNKDLCSRCKTDIQITLPHGHGKTVYCEEYYLTEVHG